jgi:glycosyltransferase involved in cell wall biosynthesis
MRELRVAHVLPVYSASGINLLGGAERYVANLTRHLARECDLTLFTFGPSRLEENLDGLRHVVIPTLGGAVENPIPRSLFLELRRFDLVHAHQLRTAVTSELAIACRAMRIPLVATDFGGGGRSLMYRLGLHRWVSRFLMISQFSVGLLPPSEQPRATAILGGIDVDRYAFSDAPRQPRVLLVARILPHKGINYLVEAAGTDIPVVIAGRVADRAYYEQMRVASHGTQVRFELDPSDEVVQDLYRSSAVTASASVYRDVNGGHWPMSELLGLTLLESMAVGTPVVCTNVGGMPEYVEDGVTGFVVPPNDAAALRARLKRLLDEPELARRMGRAGHEHVQQYSWRSVAARSLGEYRRLFPTVS